MIDVVIVKPLKELLLVLKVIF